MHRDTHTVYHGCCGNWTTLDPNNEKIMLSPNLINFKMITENQTHKGPEVQHVLGSVIIITFFLISNIKATTKKKWEGV